MGIYHVVIVGAGAAGLNLASEIEKGMKVLLIDKRKNPHKRIACAEWVPEFLEIREVVQRVEGLVMEYSGIRVRKRWRGKIIDRERWQKRLLESLRYSEVHTGEKVELVERGRVITDKGVYEGDYIVGADGPFSVVRRSFNIKTDPLLPAINVKVPLRESMEQARIYFFKEIEKGYGWLFPRREIANAGVGAVKNLKKTLDFFLDYLVKSGLIKKKIVSISAGFIPLYDFVPMVDERVFLIGDASGLTDPLTGAGIYQAYDSARILAKVLKGEKSKEDYIREMELSYGRFLKRRHAKRRIFEDSWNNLKEAVERAWISTFRG